MSPPPPEAAVQFKAFRYHLLKMVHRAPIHGAFLNLAGKRMALVRLMPTHDIRMETNCRTASKPADIAIFLVVPVFKIIFQ